MELEIKSNTSKKSQHLREIMFSPMNDGSVQQREPYVGSLCGPIISSKEALLVSDVATLLSSALNDTGAGVRQPLHKFALKLKNLFVSKPTKCFQISSLSLKQDGVGGFVPRSSKDMLENVAAQNMSATLDVGVDELKDIPMRLLVNLNKSLMQLVYSRLRSSVSALIEQSSRKGNQALNSEHPVIQHLLSTSPLAKSDEAPIVPSTIVTTFRTLAFSERVGTNKYSSSLIMECVFDINVLGKLTTITVEAPGTISCLFDGGQAPKIEQTEIDIDTLSLLQSMIGQARIVTKAAISRAFGTYGGNSNTVALGNRLVDFNKNGDSAKNKGSDNGEIQDRIFSDQQKDFPSCSSFGFDEDIDLSSSLLNGGFHSFDENIQPQRKRSRPTSNNIEEDSDKPQDGFPSMMMSPPAKSGKKRQKNEHQTDSRSLLSSSAALAFQLQGFPSCSMNTDGPWKNSPLINARMANDSCKQGKKVEDGQIAPFSLLSSTALSCQLREEFLRFVG